MKLPKEVTITIKIQTTSTKDIDWIRKLLLQTGPLAKEPPYIRYCDVSYSHELVEIDD
jgi:hypothetical protein